MPNYRNISALCSVYADTDPKEFKSSLKSVMEQSLPPKEIVIVLDGTIKKDIEEIINNNKIFFNIRSFKLTTNKGLGNALKFGTLKCKYNIIARFDTDDISLKERFKKQISYINLGWDLVSSSVIEYDKLQNNKNLLNFKIKTISKNNREIKKSDLTLRNPINHPSVMFNINKMNQYNINYRSQMKKHQDFLLWRELKFNPKINFNMIHISDITIIMNSNKLIEKRSSLKSFFFELLLFYYSIFIKKRIDLEVKIFFAFFVRLLIIYTSPFIYRIIRNNYTIKKNRLNFKVSEEINKILTRI